MTTVDPSAPEGQEPVTSTPAPAPAPAPALEIPPAWLSSIRATFADIQAAVEDEQRPLRERRLGHLEAVRITREGFLTIEKALSYAERGIPRTPPLR
jgi:hypothetical protein